MILHRQGVHRLPGSDSLELSLEKRRLEGGQVQRRQDVFQVVARRTVASGLLLYQRESLEVGKNFEHNVFEAKKGNVPA